MKKHFVPITLIVLLGAFGLISLNSTKLESPELAQEKTSQNTGPKDGIVFVEADNFDGEIFYINRISISVAPAWLVLYNDTNGIPGKKIGEIYLEKDDIESPIIEIGSNFSVGDIIYLLLHDDTGEQNVFEFPAGDQPFVDMQPLRVPLTTRTRPANLNITPDDIGENKNKNIEVESVVTE